MTKPASIPTLSGAVIAACAVFAASAARAEAIDFTITQGANSVMVSGGSTSAVINTIALNTALAGIGSAYQFIDLTGTSNFPGTTAQGQLGMVGTVMLPFGATGNIGPIMITETESGFTSPTGGPANIGSASTGQFTIAPAGNTITTHGSLNSIFSAPLTYTSTGEFVNNASGRNDTAVPSFSTPYTLDNEVTVNLTQSFFPDNPSFGAFTISTLITPTSAPEIPLPSAIYLFGSVLGSAFWLGRRKRGAVGGMA